MSAGLQRRALDAATQYPPHSLGPFPVVLAEALWARSGASLAASEPGADPQQPPWPPWAPVVEA